MVSMMTKEEITIAVKQWNKIKIKYPEFNKMFNMIMELHYMPVPAQEEKKGFMDRLLKAIIKKI